MTFTLQVTHLSVKPSRCQMWSVYLYFMCAFFVYVGLQWWFFFSNNDMLLVFSDSDFNCAQWCTFYGTFTVIHSVSFNVEIQGRLCRATETITDYQQKLCGTQPARNRMKVPSSVCFLAGGGGGECVGGNGSFCPVSQKNRGYHFLCCSPQVWDLVKGKRKREIERQMGLKCVIQQIQLTEYVSEGLFLRRYLELF